MISQKIGGLVLATFIFSVSGLSNAEQIPDAVINKVELGKKLAVGDVVFVRIPIPPFTEVADTTSTWTNHVGIVIEVSGSDPVIAESRFPLSGKTTFTKFIGRSDKGRVAVTRLPIPLTPEQQAKLRKAAEARNGILYDTGFNLHSHKQFCSRYVREVLNEATDINIGEVEKFSVLLKNNPNANQTFWKTWFFGGIPWNRETVTPASELQDKKMHVVFDGRAV
jgi:hypothetical protein